MKKCVKRIVSKFTYNDNKKKLVGLNENKIKILISGVKYELLIIITIGVKLTRIAYKLLRCNVAIWAHKKQFKQPSKFSPLLML
jgi:hypothetical protein